MKLVLVTVSAKGKTITRLFELPIVNGHAQISADILDGMAYELGLQKGQTYTYG